MSDSVNETSVPGSNTRAVICGGENDSPAIINTMEYITIKIALVIQQTSVT